MSAHEFIEAMGVAQLQFSRNREKGAGKSGWISSFDSTLVFSSPDFDSIASKSPELTLYLEGGNPLWVLVRHLSSGYYQAIMMPELPNIKRPIVEEKSTVVLFDAHNMLHSLHDLGGPVDVVGVVKSIIDHYEVQEAFFYVCTKSSIKHGFLTPAIIQRLGKINKLTMVDRAPKVIRDCGEAIGRKTDIDHLVVKGITEIYYQRPGLKRIVLVGGDSDYADALRLWSDGHGGSKIVEVVSTRGAVAQEMFDYRVLPLDFFLPQVAEGQKARALVS